MATIDSLSALLSFGLTCFGIGFSIGLSLREALI